MSLPVIRLLIEYDGESFLGWQRQPTGPSIQAHLEDILELLSGKKVIVYGASRTDSGVHAAGQVAHFYPSVELPESTWLRAINFHLPKSIRVLEVKKMPPEFHAQRLAVLKTYHYRILNRSHASGLDRRVYFFPRKLAWDRMDEALPFCVGKKDFKAFQNAKAETLTTVRTLVRAEHFEEGMGFHRITFEGTGFLKQMVRILVGTLIEVGEGRRSVENFAKLFEESATRMDSGPTAPPSGLILWKVHYPDDWA